MDAVILSISDLSDNLKYHLESSNAFKNINIKGEISNLTYNKSGHIYFSLKDADSKVDCAIWKSNAQKFTDLNPSEGTEIIATGTISFYKPSGKITFTVVDVKIDGIGALAELYTKRFKEYEAKGWFAQEFKKSIKKIPLNIGIITAATGDAVRDLITTMKRRFPIVNIFLFPTLVQGDGAAKDISKKIKQANDFSPQLDTLIVGRGGGSYEDLWAFNEIEVIEAIKNSDIPIISGVGHEPDITLTDHVADLRASTPTAAGEAATPDVNVLINSLNSTHQNFANILLTKINNIKTNFNNITTNLHTAVKNKIDKEQNNLNSTIESFRSSFTNKIRNIKINLINFQDYFAKSLKTKLEIIKQELEKQVELINLLDPTRPLLKGFALIMQDKKTLKSVNDIDSSKPMSAKLIDGTLKLSIDEIIRED
ncbi:exodeoxyribonuclease VII large subunit [Spiroplasma culicicola]|uniref:Exodeoxyribonuclease 7 large subunit n=1 Tax=Spiroplasma culicicola AES-1 TaxID=1276246 RepID=W6A6Z4_9MOLU|nr:exodeoxyribonuclease VII large subunit [Spiroplasma culicicola]AHI52908.1 exodeoxyribonuclease VII large subunit [Spiroplasma culicicola AES-1]